MLPPRIIAILQLQLLLLSIFHLYRYTYLFCEILIFIYFFCKMNHSNSIFYSHSTHLLTLQCSLENSIPLNSNHGTLAPFWGKTILHFHFVLLVSEITLSFYYSDCFVKFIINPNLEIIHDYRSKIDGSILTKTEKTR